MLVGLQQEGHTALLQVEDDRGVPVLGGVHIALGGGGDNKVAMAEARLDNPIPELQLLPGFVCHVAQADSFPTRHRGLSENSSPQYFRERPHSLSTPASSQSHEQRPLGRFRKLQPPFKKRIAFN